jgi:hypothetical protein
MASKRKSPHSRVLSTAIDALQRQLDQLRAQQQAGDTDWAKVVKVCPKCGEEKPVNPDFGTATKRDVVRAQSWCRTCRARTPYETRARKYRSKHNR